MFGIVISDIKDENVWYFSDVIAKSTILFSCFDLVRLMIMCWFEISSCKFTVIRVYQSFVKHFHETYPWRW